MQLIRFLRLAKCALPVIALLMLCSMRAAAQGSAVPKEVQLAPAARMAIDAPARSAAERAQARVEFGQWTEEDLADAALRARAAIDAGVPSVVVRSRTVPAGVPPLLAAEALADQGLHGSAIEVLTDLPGCIASAQRAECFLALGRSHEARSAAEEAVRDVADGKCSGSAELVAVARAMIVLSRVVGADTDACEAILEALSQARTIDRLNWRARVVEAAFLLEKHNPEDAVAAAREALALNPRSSAAWEVLGEVALMGFDFDGAERAAAAMCDAAQEIDAAQPCLRAARLRAESACCRFDSAAALDALAAARSVAPQWMDGLALEAAAKALTYDFDAMRAALAAADAIAPKSGSAWMVVGRFLSLARQYREAADVLAEAARREPTWSGPRNELGLLEMQAGRDREALDALTEAQRLDPYDKRVRFSKMLVEELMGWRVWESEHFRVRCKPGVDEVLAEDMPAQLEAMHAEVTKRFDHVPRERTTIELMPDHRTFGVRITGMPQIHTVAASTGPVIALEPPREGGTGGSIGRFDWLDTLRHEFVHTVTLDRTANRIPHWFTEAVAVDTEHRERDWPTYELLARALQQDGLFDLDEIKWAFVRPKKPSDRSQAYAQGHWMVQFMRESYGQATITQLLDRAARGEREADAFVAVLGISRERFMADFKAWAAAQVDSWGLAAKPPLVELLKSARAGDAAADGDAGDAPISSERLSKLLAQYPAHPDVLELAARRAVREAEGSQDGGTGGDPAAPARENVVKGALPESAVALLRRYALARPLDPWPRRRLAAVAIDAQRWDEARDHLAFLDAREDADPAYALELARIERLRKQPRAALVAAERAARIDPFSAPTRELAAACAVEAGELSAARRHVLALTRIEPMREQHRRRLERLDALIAERGAQP
jgi:tetratricopeptide (TPR) repeat protein